MRVPGPSPSLWYAGWRLYSLKMRPDDDPITQMEFTAQDIREFQDIIKAEYGVELSEGDAAVMAKRLLSLYEIIARPLPEELEAMRRSSS